MEDDRAGLLLELVSGAATAFGVKIAPDHLVGVRVDLDGEVLEQFDAPLDVTAAGAVDRIGDLLETWIAPRAPARGCSASDSVCRA